MLKITVSETTHNAARRGMEPIEGADESASGWPSMALPPSLAEADDPTLVAIAKSGNNQAFESLVQRHQRRILALVFRFTGIREDAEDITQQSLQKAFTCLPQFREESSFSTWLTQIAINETRMWKRRRKRAFVELPLGLSDESETSVARNIPDPGPTPEEISIHEEWREILSVAITKLSPPKRQAIELFDLQERSLLEISQLVGLTVPALKSRILRARRSLYKRLKGFWNREGNAPACGRRKAHRTVRHQQLAYHAGD